MWYTFFVTAPNLVTERGCSHWIYSYLLLSLLWLVWFAISSTNGWTVINKSVTSLWFKPATKRGIKIPRVATSGDFVLCSLGTSYLFAYGHYSICSWKVQYTLKRYSLCLWYFENLFCTFIRNFTGGCVCTAGEKLVDQFLRNTGRNKIF